MHPYIKRGVSLLLCFAMVFALSACAGRAMTEDNITKTVELVEKALREFDRETLQKYVSSKTLNNIFNYANNHEQFDAIGKLLFEMLEINIKSIDVENKEITAEIKNRDMTLVGERYSQMLQYKSKGDLLAMLDLLNDEDFLNLSERVLTSLISRATVPDNPTEVTLGVKKGSKNLIITFGDEAENAVSGGLIAAITETLPILGGSGSQSITEDADAAKDESNG